MEIGRSEFFDFGPKRHVVFVKDCPSADRIWSNVKADCAVSGRPVGLFDRFADVLHRKDRGPSDPVAGLGTVVRAPIVVGAAAGGEQLRVTKFAAQHLARGGRINDLDVDALLVHIEQATLGTEAELRGALETLHRLAHCVQETRRGHRILSLLARERLAFDQKGATARLGSNTHFWRLGLVTLVDISFEYVVRFHQVSIYINDLESVSHTRSPDSY